MELLLEKREEGSLVCLEKRKLMFRCVALARYCMLRLNARLLGERRLQ
jgi:hypothetical protein